MFSSQNDKKMIKSIQARFIIQIGERGEIHSVSPLEMISRFRRQYNDLLSDSTTN